MQLDYDFLKKILGIMQEEKTHIIDNFILAEKLKIMEINTLKVTDDELWDKFIGHILLLRDNGCVDSSSRNCGFNYNNNSGDYIASNVDLRLTTRGYEFIEILNKNTILEIIKGMSITMAMHIGSALLVDKIKESIRIN